MNDTFIHSTQYEAHSRGSDIRFNEPTGGQLSGGRLNNNGAGQGKTEESIGR